MRKIGLSVCVIFSLLASDAYALSDCAEGEVNCWDCGKTESDLCTARLDTAAKSLSITGSGEMRDYQGDWNNGNPILNTPWGAKTYTSISVQGVKNIGNSAFRYAIAENVTIEDTVATIGEYAFSGAINIKNINIPDSVTKISGLAFLNTTGIPSAIFVPESVNQIETLVGDLHVPMGPFESSTGQLYLLYCAETTPCYASNADKIVNYTKDSNGVYKIGNNYYASPDDILANSSCGSGSSASQDCINSAAAYQDQKAENMAGGALCATKQECLKLINRANKKDVCNSIADCANNYDRNCFKQGNVVYNGECIPEYPFAKKHWTPAEAAQYLKDTDNEIIMTFKVNR